MEFSRRKELYLFSRVVGTEDMKIHFKFLIGSLGLTISLRMIGSGQANIVSQEMSKFFGEG